GTKIVSVPKKRMRTAQGGNDIEAGVIETVKEMAVNTTHVKASTSNLKGADMGTINKKGAGNDTAVHTNPLFDVDIVMAGTG
ncbi:hypothetical protein A2U01_0091279, partial [Trifolium medium]|nr:hypothetical protein [Trifolium medium]